MCVYDVCLFISIIPHLYLNYMVPKKHFTQMIFQMMGGGALRQAVNAKRRSPYQRTKFAKVKQ